MFAINLMCNGFLTLIVFGIVVGIGNKAKGMAGNLIVVAAFPIAIIVFAILMCGNTAKPY